MGRGAFRVADFVPPTLEVSVAAPEEAGPGEELAFSVRSRYYTGAPAAGLPLQGHLDFLPAPFQPEGWERWAFGDEEKKYVPGSGREFKLELAEDGRAEIAAEAPGDISPPAALEASLSASVLEASGRAVTARGSSRVYPYPFYIGILGLNKDQTLPAGAPCRQPRRFGPGGGSDPGSRHRPGHLALGPDPRR